MKAQNVCTIFTTHRRIVSLNPKALGASGSNIPIKNQKSKIKNVLRAPDFLKNFEIFYFHFLTKNLSLSRSTLTTEGANFQIRNLKSAFRNRLGALDYRRLSRIIGFEISLS